MRLKQSSVIHSKKIGDGVVLLEPNKKYIRQLNQTASFLWNQLSKEKTIDELINALKAKFKVNQKQAEKDIASWVKDYLQQGFLQKK